MIPELRKQALSALINNPDLVDECGLDGSHFEEGCPLAAVFVAIPRATDRTREGGIQPLQLAALAGVDKEVVFDLVRWGVRRRERAREVFAELRREVRWETDSAKLRMLAAGKGDYIAIGKMVEEFSRSDISTASPVPMSDLERRFVVDLGSHQGGSLRLGIPKVDQAIKGFRPGEVTVVFGGAGVGKSTWVIDAMRRLAARGTKSLFFSCEMTGTQLGEKAIHAQARVPLSCEIDRAEAEQALAELLSSGASENILVDLRPRVTPAEALASCRRNPEACLVVFDHLRHLDVKGESRYDRIGLAAAEFKRLAKASGLPWIVLTHVNRRTDGADRPTLDMIRDSGQVAEEVDNVLAMWRRDGGSSTELWALKTRASGYVGLLATLAFKPDSQSFAEGK